MKQYDSTLNAELRLAFTKQFPSVFSDAYISQQLAVKGEGVLEVVCDSSQTFKWDFPSCSVVSCIAQGV